MKNKVPCPKCGRMVDKDSITLQPNCAKLLDSRYGNYENRCLEYCEKEMIKMVENALRRI